MFTYTLRNLRLMFTKQRLLSLLLVLNIIVSCLVICFSYGLYENYHQVMEEGEIQPIDQLPAYISSDAVTYLDDAPIPICDITPQQIMDMMKALQPDTQQTISSLRVDMITKTPLMYKGTADDTYSEDAKPAYIGISYTFRADGDKIVDPSDDFTDEQYANGEKVVILNHAFIDKRETFFWTSYHDEEGEDGYYYSVEDYESQTRTMPFTNNEVLIGGEKYEVIEIRPYSEFVAILKLPFTAAPSDSRIQLKISSSGRANCFIFSFRKSITKDQYNDIQKCLRDYVGEDVHLETIEFATKDDLNYYRTVMAIAFVIAVLAAINMAILYRYILEKRSSELAIFRICGCSKGKAVASYLLECMMINAPLFALTQLAYHKLVMPQLAGIFPHIAEAYHIRLYLAMFSIYVIASVIVMLIMITVTVRRHSLVSLKSATRSTSKFSVMKVFEMLQLAAVLSIMVMIVSAVVSRYGMFKPFEQYLSQRGYIVLDVNFTQYDDLISCVNGAAVIATETNDVFDQSHNTGIAYPDEYINAYKPDMAKGKWLSDIDETYENSGYIPIVLSPCDGEYKVGDIIKSLYADVGYKVVGILEKETMLVSYITDTNLDIKDHTDLYSVFNDDTAPGDLAVMRASDVCECFGGHGALRGIQFVFCDDISDAEYSEIGENLSGRFRYMPLDEFYANSKTQIYEQMYTLFPIAACIFILTIISTVSISAIYTKRQLRNYAIFYICGARWRTCALRSLKNGAITCAVAAVLSALILIVGKSTLLKDTVISFGMWHFAVCAGVIVLYLILSMIMPLSIIGSAEPREVLKEE